MALRTDSSDAREEGWHRVVFRAVSHGYGISCIDQVEQSSLERAAQRALKQAKASERTVELIPVQPEQGKIDFQKGEEFDLDEVASFLKDLRDGIKSRLGAKTRTELVASHSQTQSTLLTSEGTKISQFTPLTDMTLYVITRDSGEGFASRVVGGIGGFEAVRNQPWDEIIESLTRRAGDATKARTLNSSGKRFKVILDPETTGAFAHEIAHFLEADIHKQSFFRELTYDLELVDDPCLPKTYGSYHWDDEGVNAEKKTLLRKGEIHLLHTRLTAKSEKDVPGNAHGILRKPRPTISNIYIAPSDWRQEEIFEDTRNGIYAEGLIRAECDAQDGRIEIEPELAYLVENKEVTTPIKHLKIVGSIEDVGKVDAIGRLYTLRPSYEKGFAVSEGGPHIRINGITCYG